jgi:ADP-heptose:LPS heptosyltransferase
MSLLKRRYPDKNNVLLVNITRLGDMLQATPTIAGIKMDNPNAKITVLVEKQFEEVCHFLPNIDEVVALDLGMTVRSLAREQDGIVDAFDYISEVVSKLRAQNFDYCLNMSSSAYTALLLKLVGIERNGGWTSDEEGYRVISSDWAKLFAASVFHQNRHYNSLNLVDIFRCSADVDKHPNRLLIKLLPEALDYADSLLREANFTNTGPIIAVQAGASQQKRQWLPRNFVEFINELVNKQNARVVMVGTKKEMEIIQPILDGVNSKNVFCAAGRTSIPQLAALLSKAQLLVTGDTGTMHVSVAAGTPVVSMFLASAFGFETGPYGEGNIIIQPSIACGPCNPNKPCARPDCHDTFSPSLVAKLVEMRLSGDFKSLDSSLISPSQAIVYRSYFDEHGFCDLEPLNGNNSSELNAYRSAYRELWLDELAGVSISKNKKSNSTLKIAKEIDGIDRIVDVANQGAQLIDRLVGAISDTSVSAKVLTEINDNLTENDRIIEDLGFNYPHLGPLSRMFIFAKENISGTDALELASQMKEHYCALSRRGKKLSGYYFNGS